MNQTSYSLYIHIPYCISKCAYCDFFSIPKKNDYDLNVVPDEYVNALCNEISFRISFLGIRELKTIYIGGGTPSLLAPEQFKKIFDVIKQKTLVDSDAEITVEVNPDDVSIELINCFSSCGVNRISCGIQSMNDEALIRACRRADYATNEKAMHLLKENWKGQISIDLISGLPGDNEESLLYSLEKITSINPDHISLYSLTIEDKTPFGKELNAGKFIYDYDEADRLWLRGRDFLEKNGYVWYEVSNFCKPGKECRHNLVYWTHKDYVGCGSGATGSLYEKDGSIFRWTNTVDIGCYISFWNNFKDREYTRDVLPQKAENIDVETSVFEFFMMGLRKIDGVSVSDFEKTFSVPMPANFINLFSEWEMKGLCLRRYVNSLSGSQADERYAMSREGILFLNPFLEKLC